ncbi:MAG: 23S rRNA (adenine(2503)-C(2))-methyltransferase RlmN [Planctomycetales bacterium]|nr:23S rRNA (adenine(2503)-C(2))-methyltransferase RlmN [Planctomycetales bacterium]
MRDEHELQISVHDRRAVDAFAREFRIDPYRLRRFRHALYQQSLDPPAALLEIPLPHRKAFAACMRFHELELQRRSDSPDSRATKLVFTTRGGNWIETVLIRGSSGRLTACLSSQAGCAVGCRFCATGEMGLLANLSASEIIAQLWQANRLLSENRERIRNVVFMGMGEPLHNSRSVAAAVDELLSTTGFQITSRRLTVSTIGIPARMREFARRFPDVHLAVSLHCVVPGVREMLIPGSTRTSLSELHAAIDEVVLTSRRAVMIEYVMIDGLTDTAEAARALVEFLGRLPVFVNLIPFNPVAGMQPWRTSSREICHEFCQMLRSAGYKARIRNSHGGEIRAACGQLANRSDATPLEA